MKEAIGKSYTYDRRGNLTGEYQEGKLLHGYEFGALNRLERAWDNTGKEAEYLYNGLGQRKGRRTKEKQEDYLLDLTRSYHNLLGLETGEERQNFYWDFGVAAMEDKDRIPRFYLQDELGSPLRVLYGNGNGNIYGYDEFGEELYEALDPEKEASNRYSRQEEGQPFGYTGYRYDAVGGTYFAQAREYKAEFGRFTAEDVVRGNGAVPKTLNRYGYCLYNPFKYVDLSGKIMQPVIPVPVWPYSTVESILDYYGEAYEAYNKQREDMPAPEMPTDTENLPDYTEEIDAWLSEKEKMFEEIDNIGDNFIKYGGTSEAVSVTTTVTKWITFYNQVKTKGEMDIKQENRWYEAFGFNKPEFFIYRGEVMDPGTLGNITYGYIGASMFPDFALYLGGGAVNIKRLDLKYIFAVPVLPYYGDAPEDYEAVKRGIELWNEDNACTD